MSVDKQNIDILFESKLKDFGEDLPHYVWENIDDSLRKEKKKKRLVYYISMAASFALLLSFGAGYVFNNSTTENKILADAALTLPSKNVISDVITSNASMQATSNGNANNQYSDRNIRVQDGRFTLIKKEFLPMTASLTHDVYIRNIETIVSLQNSQDVTATVPKNTDLENAVHENETSVVISDTLSKKKSEFINPQDLYTYPDDDLAIVTPAKGSSSWTVEGQISPANSYGSSTGGSTTKSGTPGGKSGTIVPPEEKQEATTNSLFVLSGGLGVKYNLAKKLSLQSGVYYSRIDNQYDQVEIPLVTSYKIIDKRASVFISGGFATGYMYWKDNVIRDPINYKSIVGIGLEYGITRDLSFNISPTFKYALPIKQNFINYNYPYNFGIFTGICYKL